MSNREYRIREYFGEYTIQTKYTKRTIYGIWFWKKEEIDEGWCSIDLYGNPAYGLYSFPLCSYNSLEDAQAALEKIKVGPIYWT